VANTRVIYHFGNRLGEHGRTAKQGDQVGEFVPCPIRHHRDQGPESITLGHPLLDDYLAFVAVRARTNTWLAVASDLKILFEVVAKRPAEVTASDVFEFLSSQRAPRRGDRVVRLDER
ncbi:MAG: hypothetical protein ACRDV8_02510, partial [Acidimicrobiales bacterium]